MKTLITSSGKTDMVLSYTPKKEKEKQERKQELLRLFKN